MRFRSVDLPALGRPTRATVPKRGFFNSLLQLLPSRPPLRIRRHFYAIDAPAIGSIDFEPQAVLRHDGPDTRDAAEGCEDESSHCFVILARKLSVQRLFQLLDAHQTADEIVAVAEI